MNPDEGSALYAARIAAAEHIGNATYDLLQAYAVLLPFKEAEGQRRVIGNARNRLVNLRHELMRQGPRE